jgi:hypothetical protein
MWWACRDTPPCFFTASAAGWVGLLLASTSLLLFYERWDPEKPCGTEWTSERVLKELFLKLGGPSRPCSFVFALRSLSLPAPFFPFFPPLAPGAPIPPTRLWHKICKKVKKKYFLTKSRQSCTFMKVGGRCAARPSE